MNGMPALIYSRQWLRPECTVWSITPSQSILLRACVIVGLFTYKTFFSAGVPGTVRTMRVLVLSGAVLTRTNGRCLALSCCTRGSSLSARSRLSLLFRPCSGNKAPESRGEDGWFWLPREIWNSFHWVGAHLCLPNSTGFKKKKKISHRTPVSEVNVRAR